METRTLESGVYPCRIEGYLFEGSLLLLSPQVMGKIGNLLKTNEERKMLCNAGRKREEKKASEGFTAFSCRKCV